MGVWWVVKLKFYDANTNIKATQAAHSTIIMEKNWRIRHLAVYGWCRYIYTHNLHNPAKPSDIILN